MKNGDQKNIIIGVLGLLLVVMAVVTILSLNGTISLTNNDTIAGNKFKTDENLKNDDLENNLNEDDVTNEGEQVDSQVKTNAIIEKYLGKWYPGFGTAETKYTNVNIKKSSNSTTGYVIDILVNKEADYNNLPLYCAENSGVCYATADESHHFGIVMAADLISVIPDYALQGTSWEFGARQ